MVFWVVAMNVTPGEALKKLRIGRWFGDIVDQGLALVWSLDTLRIDDRRPGPKKAAPRSTRMPPRWRDAGGVARQSSILLEGRPRLRYFARPVTGVFRRAPDRVRRSFANASSHASHRDDLRQLTVEGSSTT